MSGSVLLHRQRSREDLQQLRAWYKIRDTLFGQNDVRQNVKKALELASVCDHPNAVWFANLFRGRDVSSREEARRVFLGCENDPRVLCFAALVEGRIDEILVDAVLMRFVEVLILAMRLHKHAWQGNLMMKSIFGGLKNLLFKESAMVCSTLEISTKMEVDARKIWEEQKRTF
jgi:hypothetical protein